MNGNYVKKTQPFQAEFFDLCDPVGIRTQDPQLRRLLLYPAELPDQLIAGAKLRKKTDMSSLLVHFFCGRDFFTCKTLPWKSMSSVSTMAL